MNLHDDETPTPGPTPTGTPPPLLVSRWGRGGNVQEAPSTHEIVQASQAIQNGTFVPGQDLQPIDNRTAEAMFSPENLAGRDPFERSGLSGAGRSQTPSRWAACGPVAIMALAASRGISITEDQALAAATKAGWTPTRGMAGPASQVAALNSIGIQAEMGSADDLARIRASVQAGDPVTLSSPGENGHYFVVEGVDEYGRMNLGNTVLALGANTTKQKWFTLQEMRTKLGPWGKVDTAIYVKDPAKPTPASGTLVSNPAQGQARPAVPPRIQSPENVPGAQIAEGAPTQATISLVRPPEGHELASETAIASVNTLAPLGTVLTLAGIQQGDPQVAARAHDQVIEGMGNWLQGDQNASWAEPYMNDVARLAYSREEQAQGRQSDPRTAPGEYIDAWKNAFYGGDERVPLVKALRQELGLGGPGQYRITVPRENLSPQYGPGSPSPAAPEPAPSTAPERMRATTAATTNPNLPGIIAQGKPQSGLVAGQAQPLDQMATIWDSAMKSTGDKGFADGIAALLIGEGGLQGGTGDHGQSFGPYQFYWGGGEGNGFERWLPSKLGRPVSRAEAQQLAHNVDLANEYYLPRAYSFYQKGIKQYPNNPVQAIAVGGHNAGAPGDPAVWRNYQNAWDNWNKGNIHQQDTVQSGSASMAPDNQNMNTLLRQATGRLADTNGNGSYPPDAAPALPGARFPVDRRPNPTYNDEGIDITNQPLYNGPARDNPNNYAPVFDSNAMAVRNATPLINYRDNRVAMMSSSPTGRMDNIFQQAAQQQDPLAGRADPSDAPTWFGQTDQSGGQTVGQGPVKDVAARLWRDAYAMTGDSTFADVVGGITNGEGGFSGQKDARGATGLFQMDPAGGWKQLDNYLQEHNVPMTRDEAAKNVDIMSDFYVSRLYKSYQRAKAAGLSNPEDLAVGTVVYQWDPQNEPGAAHNAGIDGVPSLEKNYRDGYREFKRGVFRLVPRSEWAGQ
jgi:hypothetical protein